MVILFYRMKTILSNQSVDIPSNGTLNCLLVIQMFYGSLLRGMNCNCMRCSFLFADLILCTNLQLRLLWRGGLSSSRALEALCAGSSTTLTWNLVFLARNRRRWVGITRECGCMLPSHKQEACVVPWNHVDVLLFLWMCLAPCGQMVG